MHEGYGEIGAVRQSGDTGEHDARRPWVAALFYVPLYLICAGGAGLLWPHPKTLLGLFALTAGLVIWRWHDRSDLCFFFTAFVLGPLGEAFAAGLGAWQYAKAELVIPLWLPFAWGITMLFLKKTAEALTGKRMSD